MNRLFNWVKNLDMGSKISYGVLVLAVIILMSTMIARMNNSNKVINAPDTVTSTITEMTITPTEIVVSSFDTRKSGETVIPIVTLIPTFTPSPIITLEPTTVPTSNSITAMYPEKIKLSQSTLVLYKNQTKQLSVEYMPENIINKKVTWSVDDGNILKITTDGLMTALDTGMATVSVASENKLIDKMVVLVLSSQEEIDKYSKVSD